MQFQFPQFIETKTKIVGPFTFYQFLWLLAGGIVIFISQFILPRTIFILFAIVIAALSFALGFLRINGARLPAYIGRAALFLIGKKKYTYRSRQQYPGMEYARPIMQERGQNGLDMPDLSSLKEIDKPYNAKEE